MLVDTSAWISFLRATGSEADRAVEALLSERSRIFTTDMVVAELLAGAGDEEAARRIGRLLASVDRCPPAGPLDLERAAYLYRRCRDAGEPVASLSVCLVAAVALRDGLEVLADDPDLEILARHADLRLSAATVSGATRGQRIAPDERPATAISAEPVPAPAQPAAASPAPSTAPRPSLVLVVEDEPSAVRMLETALARPDRRIVLASTAREARMLIAQEPPDAILLDLVLPDEDGRNVLADLRRNPKTKDTGVVVVTGKAGPRTREECFALGADDFFDKPFEARAVSEAVEIVLAEGRSFAADPDPLMAPLILSEVQKLLNARRGGSGEPLWTVGLIEIDTGENTDDPAERRDGGAHRAPTEPMLTRLLRSVIGALMPKLEDGELLARWGIDHLVVVSPGRSEDALAALIDELTRVPGLEKHMYGRVRRVGLDEDLLDAVSTMASNLAEERDQDAPHVAITSAEPRARPHAALVEDDPVTAGLVRHRLERSGFVVAHFTDGALALDGIMAAQPDVAILDVQLPSMDGFEVLRRMRENATTMSVPVLMFTSLGRQEHVQRGFELGADDYVTKPFSPSELLTRVLRLVRKR